MKKEFYDFLFNMRVSHFRHHTPDYEKQLSLFLLSGLPAEQPFSFLDVDGSGGIISESQIRELRNFMIGCTFIYCRIVLQENVDCETAYYISDFYLNKAEFIKSEKDLLELLLSMTTAYKNLIHFAQTPDYGYPINKCINFISQNLYSDLSLGDIATYMNLNKAYLTTLFKQRVGHSICQYIQLRKNKEAQVLLTHTSKSLTLIASALGYNSLAHFSRIFKTYSGMTPTAYRRKNSNIFAK